MSLNISQQNCQFPWATCHPTAPRSSQNLPTSWTNPPPGSGFFWGSAEENGQVVAAPKFPEEFSDFFVIEKKLYNGFL